MVKKIDNKYFVYSEDGNKKLSKGYATKEEADKRLKAIEYFKHMKDEDIDLIFKDEEIADEEYQGKKVSLNKPFRNTEGKSKFSVYVKNDKNNVVKVNFGDPNMEIKRDDPDRQKAFRERHNCTEKKDKTKAGYWSCKFWSSKNVGDLLDKESKMKDSKKGTYVSVKIKNAKKLVDWFSSQGVKTIIPEQLHSTISYSRSEFKREPSESEIVVPSFSLREIAPLGDEGAIVLKYDSEKMQNRFNECIKAGATYDYDEYIPHITISYNGKDLNLNNLKIPDFDIVLYNETVEPLNLDWKEDVKMKDEVIFLSDKAYMKEDMTIISARDGIQEYMDVEINQGNTGKILKVYRPPDDIDKINKYMKDLPITKGHVDLGVKIPNNKIIGKVTDSKIEKLNDVKNKTTKGLKNTISPNDKMLKLSDKEFSLGYFVKLESADSNEYDFVQRLVDQSELEPHEKPVEHLALVENARCGNTCTFLKDEQINKEQIVDYKEMVDAYKKMGDEDKKKFMKDMGMYSKEDMKDMEKEMKDNMSEEKKEDMKDMEKDMEKEKEKMKDEAIQKFKDSDTFAQAIKDGANKRACVMNKASKFLDSKYDYNSKDINDIMRDSLAIAFKDEKFEDSQLEGAFKTMSLVGNVTPIIDKAADKKPSAAAKYFEDKEI